MQFDEKQYHRLLQWADDRLRKWNIPNLTGIDLIHEALLIVGNDENKIRKQAEKVLNDEVRYSMSIARIANGVIVNPVRKTDLHILEEKKCGTCKQVKSVEEFRVVKGHRLYNDCKECEAKYRRSYKRRKYVKKRKFTFKDAATGKKYYSLPEACKDLGLKYSTVANYFRKNGHKNKTTLKAL